MKAITLWQPWASLVAVGAKVYETRSWRTNYRGELAIHAAKRRPLDGTYRSRDALPAREIEPMIEALHGIPFNELPLGAIVAIVRLYCVRPADAINPAQQNFGDFRVGRWAWGLEAIRAVEPIPTRGYQGLWNWNPEASL